MQVRELFERCLNDAARAVDQLKPADFSRPTPDDEWNARTLANHMLYELSWIPDILSGKRLADVGSKYDGDLLGDDPHEAWHKAAALARGEVRLADLHRKVHLSYGNTRGQNYLEQVSGDLLIHAWDLAAALGLTRTMDQEAVEHIYKGLRTSIDDLQAFGIYKPPRDVPEDSDTQTKLLALTGRDAAWST
jgi:uncharacterized protein (TIGR03086 family)